MRLQKNNDPDLHAERRDAKITERKRPTDNRKSVILIAKLATVAKKKR